RPPEEEVISGNTSFPVEASSIYELGMDGRSSHDMKLRQQYSENEDFSTSTAESSEKIMHLREQAMKIQAKIDIKNKEREEKKCDTYKCKGRSLSSGLLHRLRSSTGIHTSVDFRCKSQEEKRGKEVTMPAAFRQESISEGLHTHSCMKSSSPFRKYCRITTHFWNSGTHTSPSQFMGSLFKAKSLVKRLNQRSHSVDNAQIVHCFNPQQLTLKDGSEDNAEGRYCDKSQTTSAPAM
ncbi:hypothetical protein KI387_041867, partial [Taxus chinensis]